MYRLVIMTTNSYPKYDRNAFDFETYEAAEKAMTDWSRTLNAQCNKGIIQDYQVELSKI